MPNKFQSFFSDRIKLKSIEGALFVVLMMALIAFALLEFYVPGPQPNPVLQKLVTRDVDYLIRSGKISASWTKAREIILQPLDQVAASDVRGLKIPLPLNAKGKYLISIFVLSTSEGNHSLLIFQFDLEDFKSHNTVAELSRSYRVLKSKKKAHPNG